MEVRGTKGVINSYESVEMRRGVNGPLYEAVRERVKEGPLIHSDLFRTLNAVPRVRGDVRALMYDMAANNAAGLGPEVGATYYLHVGCLYDASTTAEQGAREQCRSTIVLPVMNRLQGILNDLPRGYWKKADRRFYRSLVLPLREAVAAWRSLDYPYAEQTITSQVLTHDLHAEVARLSEDRPMLIQEIAALMKLYGYDEASIYNVIPNWWNKHAFFKQSGVTRYLYRESEMEPFIYNPAKYQSIEPIEQLSSTRAEIAMLREQRMRLAGGIEGRLRAYLIRQYDEADLYTLYPDAE